MPGNTPSPIFRQAALDRLSSPDQLDALMRVTSPQSWIALAGLGLLLATVVAWGVFGTIPIKVAAQGVLIRPGGVYDVHTRGDALIEAFLVSEGTLVAANQPVARIAQPALDLEIRNARAQLAELRAQQRTVDVSVPGELRIDETVRRIELLERQLAEASLVTSPHAGRVVEIKRNEGAMVAAGTALLSLELTGPQARHLQVIAYVPAGRGHEVREGMTVQVSPTTAPRQEYGFLYGTVRTVSRFPATPDGMARVLGDPTRVQGLAAQGPPFATYIALEPDEASASGYRWSSSRGNSVPLASGTLCTVSITVRVRRPIAMLIPMLEQALGS